MPATTTSVSVSIADVLTTARALLGPAWMQFISGDGKAGSLRTHRGHIITLDGFAGRSVYATALLPNGRRVPYAGQAEAATTEAYAATLVDMIRTTLVPLHDSVCPTKRTVNEVHRILKGRCPGSYWQHGTARANWALSSGGRASAVIRPSSSTARHTGLGTVTFADPSTAEAAAVLRAIDTSNADPRQYDPVHGDLAQLLAAAGPGLRPVATYDRPTLGGRLTSILTVDGVVTVELAYRNAGVAPSAWVARVAVSGSLSNVLAAIRAV
jgi:hypothetical protein